MAYELPRDGGASFSPLRPARVFCALGRKSLIPQLERASKALSDRGPTATQQKRWLGRELSAIHQVRDRGKCVRVK
jgi:hypothetical protein